MIKIPFGKPIVSSKEFRAVLDVLKSGKYVHGRKTEEFEELFRKFVKSRYAITVSSCTAGMHLFYFAIGLSKGDEVILPAQTHVATAHAVELLGAKPVFVDCELETGNIDVKKIEKKISKKTKAIAVVHFLGVPADMIKIKKIAKKHKLFILEDCALSLGAKIRGKHTGLFGDAGVFSFYPVKHITTGEGGILITNNKKISEKIKSKKAFGVDKNYNQRNYPGKYDVKELGLNYRMSEIHASIGVEQIKKIKKFLKIRKRNFDFLIKKLKDIRNIKILKNKNKDFSSSNYCMSLILDKKISMKRSKIVRFLNNNGIGTSIYYPKPVPLMSYYKKKYKHKSVRFKNASIISDKSIALSVGPHISLENLDYVSRTLKKIIA